MHSKKRLLSSESICYSLLVTQLVTQLEIFLVIIFGKIQIRIKLAANPLLVNLLSCHIQTNRGPPKTTASTLKTMQPSKHTCQTCYGNITNHAGDQKLVCLANMNLDNTIASKWLPTCRFPLERNVCN